jgi:glycosyltransferase involved in cell wall biosynthesis
VIRVYGQSRGWHSFAVVSRGMSRGFEANEALAGFYPTDAFVGEDDQIPGGGSAPVAVLCGRPDALHVLGTAGVHKRKYLVLAPNSTWVPQALLRQCERDDIGLISPSEWGRGIIESALVDYHMSVPDVCVVPHGILPGFMGGPDPEGPFKIIHFATSSLARKGTFELIRAFQRWRWRKDAKLSLFVAPAHIPRVSIELADETVDVFPSLNAEPDGISLVYRQAHVIACPSRSEGFGLIPLEARACGVPVLMTDCSGHLEHMPLEAVTTGMADGVVRIRTGPMTELSNECGGKARTVDEDSIIEALDLAYSRWEELRQGAILQAMAVRRKWDWAVVTRQFVERAATWT